MPAGGDNWILRWIEARTPVELRDYVVGDLEEEFNERRARGAVAAWWWLVGQAIRFEPGDLRQAAGRLDGRWGRGRPGRMHLGEGGTEMILKDLKYVVRRLVRSPVFTVVRSMTASGPRLALIGAVLGVMLGLAAGLGLERYLFGVRAFDPITFLVLPCFLLGVAVLAAWLPARRAAKVDPMVALRAE